MSISELVNAPIEVCLCGKKLKMQRMSLKEIFAPIQAKILNDYHTNVNDMAKNLSGKDKTDFMLQALKQVPSKGELDRLAFEYMSSATGMAEMLINGLNKCQAVSEQEISDLILRANEEELAYVQSYLTGEDIETVKKKLKEQLTQK